jgi:hypothetical protein
MKDRNLPIDNNWITPKWFYDLLDSEFHFDHDPCPYNTGTITPDKDGLNRSNKWGRMNFVNPPYERKLKESFIIRAANESAIPERNTSVLLIPVSTSTKIFHSAIYGHAEIRFVEGRIKFQKKDIDGHLYTPKNGGMHDSMIVIFEDIDKRIERLKLNTSAS